METTLSIELLYLALADILHKRTNAVGFREE